MDPVHDMLITATVRRANDAAFLAGLERSDARNHALGVGPGPDAVTKAVFVRQLVPGRGRLNAALARLADLTHRA